jgi:RNA recognition motif-containing protein
MNKAKVKLNDKVFIIKAKHIDTVQGFPFENDGLYHDVFKITISNAEGIKRSFRYYGSYHNFKIGKRDFTEEELLEIFKEFLSEAQLGDMTFEDFCDELGFSTDSKKAYRIWKACKEQLKKALDLGIFIVSF